MGYKRCSQGNRLCLNFCFVGIDVKYVLRYVLVLQDYRDVTLKEKKNSWSLTFNMIN